MEARYWAFGRFGVAKCRISFAEGRAYVAAVHDPVFTVYETYVSAPYWGLLWSMVKALPREVRRCIAGS